MDETGKDEIVDYDEYGLQKIFVHELKILARIQELLGRSFKRGEVSIVNYHVTELVLTKGNLSKFPPELCELVELRILKINNMGITAIPNDIGKLKRLWSLDLSNNKINTLPDSIVFLENLQMLILSQNNLSSLPSSIGQLKNLRILDIEANKIVKLPQSARKLRLTVLNIKNNSIRELNQDEWIFLSKIKLFGSQNLIGNPIDFIKFRKIYKNFRNEDHDFELFLKSNAFFIFNTEQREELEEIIDRDGVIFQKDTRLRHKTWLEINKTFSRAIYGSLITTGFIRLYEEFFKSTVNLGFYLTIISFELILFLVINIFPIRLEGKVRNRRRIFGLQSIDDPIHDLQSFIENLEKKFYSLEYELVSSRYEGYVAFFSNAIVSSFTTILLLTFTAPLLPTEDVIDYFLNVQSWTDQFRTILLFLGLINIFMIIFLIILLTSRIPNLEIRMRREYNFMAGNYQKMWQEKQNSSAYSTNQVEIRKEIYEPMYSRVISSIKLIERNIFDRGERRNGLGEKILGVFDALERKLLWTKIHPEISDAVKPIKGEYEIVIKAEKNLYDTILNMYLDQTRNSNEAGKKKNFDAFNDIVHYILVEKMRFSANQLSRISQIKKHLKISYSDPLDFWNQFRADVKEQDSYWTYYNGRRQLLDTLYKLKSNLESLVR